ncbi:hypothetical protein L1887_00978 [Cichorium endivia]|nr:hypothetical protein L1887_00978 [Cichorium endivia]
MLFHDRLRSFNHQSSKTGVDSNGGYGVLVILSPSISIMRIYSGHCCFEGGIVLQRGADFFRRSGSLGSLHQLQYTVAKDVHSTSSNPGLSYATQKSTTSRTNKGKHSNPILLFDGGAAGPRKGIRSCHVAGSKCIPFAQMLHSPQTLLSADHLKKKFEQEGKLVNFTFLLSVLMNP